MVGFVCLCRLRADKLTSEADKPFEGISKVVSLRISHSWPDNVNGYRTDEDFLWTDVSSNGWRFFVNGSWHWHVLKHETTKRNDRIELHSFFYKNLFYKNVEAEMYQNFKNMLRTYPRQRVRKRIYFVHFGDCLLNKQYKRKLKTAV